MIKKWIDFINESNQNDESLIISKMKELEDLISNLETNYNLMYEWESNDDHQLIINFSLNDENIKYEFDIDDLFLTKSSNSGIDYQESLTSIEEGLDMIEKDIQSILGLNESYMGKFDSSIQDSEILNLLPEIHHYQKFFDNGYRDEKYTENLESEIKELLSNYNEQIRDFVVDSFCYCLWEPKDWKMATMKILDFEDSILDAIKDVINYLKDKLGNKEELIEEKRRKSEYYKGIKIPGKYLAGPHPSKMKKEIGKYRGKSEYKKEWDADYETGKGGVGKRVKTKKSPATKAFHKMFGKKDKD